MSKLRTYAYMNKRSQKVKDGEAEFRAVYKIVDARSEGRCEYVASIASDLLPAWATRSRRPGLLSCARRATDHHHLYKPRRANHEPQLIVHLCRHHHDRASWPYRRGRLVISLVGGRHTYRIVFAADKFALREA